MQMNIQGLLIIMDEAQVMLGKTPTGASLLRAATRVIAAYTQTAPHPVLSVSGTSFGLSNVQPKRASGLLKPGQRLPTMAPSPLKSADVVGIVRQVLQSEPPDAVGELLHGRGRFVMTFLTEVLRVEVADAVYGSGVRARAQPAADDVRASKCARTAASGSAAGAGAALDVAVGGIGDGGVAVAKLDLRQRDTTDWLEQLANAERLMLFGGRVY